MKNIDQTLRWLAIAMLCVSLPPGMAAQDATLPSGQYHTEVTLGPVHLAGSYPCYLADLLAGSVEVTTSRTGALAGSVTLGGRTELVTGQLTSRATGLRLTLRAKAREGRISVKAVLAGSEFVGTAVISGNKAPCRINVSAVGPLLARCDLALTTAANGTISGTGICNVARLEIPVTARGRATHGKVTLAVKEKNKWLLNTSAGTIDAAGFIAGKWVAQGFGTLTKGGNLRFARATP